MVRGKDKLSTKVITKMSGFFFITIFPNFNKTTYISKLKNIQYNWKCVNH